MFPQAGIECGDTLDDMLGIVLHKAKTAKVGNEMHVSLSLLSLRFRFHFFSPSYVNLIFFSINRGRISSVDRALDCRAEVVGSIRGDGPILRVLK